MKSVEHRPIRSRQSIDQHPVRPEDEDGLSLHKQDTPQPAWGTKTEARLKAKRGATGRSRHPGRGRHR